MKKLTLFILTLIMATGCCTAFCACNGTTTPPPPNPQVVINDTDGLGYVYNERLQGYILNSLNGVTETKIGIPATYEGAPVKAIACGVFTNESNVTAVKIPNSVGRVEDGAFEQCLSLETILVDKDNTDFCAQDGILYNKECTEIIAVPKAIKGEITLPNTLTSIGERQFERRNGITQVNFPQGFETIGDYAFYMCQGLVKADWPTSMIKVGHGAFYGCKKLATLFIPIGIEYLGGYCFYGCTLLKYTYAGTQTQWYDMLEVAFVDANLTTEEQEKMYWIAWDSNIPTFAINE